ncbi:MAG TPA: RHS repeat domain-containing protein, partial [Candidatus Saccharimonadales bacterium]|nr:RHS repeat domain-containing protein [Candidatus Saccharimonadales bacterium]
MKQTIGHLRYIVAFFLGILWIGDAIAQSTTGVPVRIWEDAITSSGSYSYAQIQIYGTFLPTASNPTGNYNVLNTDANPSDEYLTSLGMVNVQPGAKYTVHINADNIDSGTVFVVPPGGYDVIMDGMYRNAEATPVAVFTIVPQFQGPPGAAGFASTISGEQVNWRLSLGFLRNGNDAGELRLADTGLESDWSALFTPATLSFATSSAEVYVYQPNNILRQIIANQVAVDIVSLNSTSYEIRCYNPDQIQSYVPCSFSGCPYVTYRIEKGTPDATAANDPTAVVLKITRETRNIVDPFQTNVPITRQDVMTLQRTGTSPNYLWTKNDWTLDGQTPLVSTTIQSGGTNTNRTESITVNGPGAAVAAKLTRAYTYYSNCGEVMTGETLGSASPRTATFNYNTSSSYPGNLGFVSSVNLPGGGWESYQYFDTGTSTSLNEGNLATSNRPYGAAPVTPTNSWSAGESEAYNYTTDPFGFNTRVASVIKYVNGTKVSQTSTEYDDTDGGANDGIVAVRSYTSAPPAQSYVTTMRYYSEDQYSEYVRSQPVSVVQPDGVMKTYTYEVGTWDGTSFAPATSGAYNGSRISEIIGVAASGGTQTLVNGRSVKNVTIRDIRALPIRTESYIWSSGAWQLTTWTNMVYNFAGLLTSRVSSNGATYSATWDGQLKTSETDESGTTLSYTYDTAGRVATITRAAAGNVPAMVTTNVYDALGNVVSQSIGPTGGEQLISSKTYDDAGRLTSETPAGLGSTSCSYDVANRIKTTTHPDGSTIVETNAIDGRLVSRGGSAVVAEFYSYGIEPTSNT